MCDLVFRLNDPIMNPEKRTGNAIKVNGERFLNSWYTCEVFKSWATPKMMERAYKLKLCTRRRKKALYERARSVLYKDGRFYRLKSNKNEHREGDIFVIVPVEGEIFTRSPKYQSKFGIPSARIRCEDGYPTKVYLEDMGEWFPVDDWDTMESWLLLDESYKAERYRPRKAA